MLNVRRQLNAKLRSEPELEKISGIVFDQHAASVASVFLGSDEDEGSRLVESSTAHDIEARDCCLSPVVDTKRRRSHS
jgi:hypothetical protein